MLPRLQSQHHHNHHPQTAMHLASPWTQTSAGATAGLAPRSDQTKNSVFSNALSSPIRRSLQPYQLAQGVAGCYPNSGHGSRAHEASSPGHNRESNSTNSNDSSMDMHADSPTNESG